MEHATRRQVLWGAGLLAGTFALSSCNTAPPEGAAAGAGADRRALVDRSRGGTSSTRCRTCTRRPSPPSARRAGPRSSTPSTTRPTRARRCSLAFSSKQMPDVFTLAGIDVPPSVLMEQGWFAPLATQDAVTKAVPEGSLVPGLHLFDGKLYSFSIFSFRQYETLVWGNKQPRRRPGPGPHPAAGIVGRHAVSGQEDDPERRVGPDPPAQVRPADGHVRAPASPRRRGSPARASAARTAST